MTKTGDINHYSPSAYIQIPISHVLFISYNQLKVAKILFPFNKKE